MSKIKKIILVVLFPLGILYCIGKNLFSGTFAGFMGAIFILVAGGILSLYLPKEFTDKIIDGINWLINGIAGLFA